MSGKYILFPIKTVNKPCIMPYNRWKVHARSHIFLSYITFSVNWCVNILMILTFTYKTYYFVIIFPQTYLWELLRISIFIEIIHSKFLSLFTCLCCLCREKMQLGISWCWTNIWSMLACCSCNSCLNNIIRRISNPSTKYLFSILLCAN